MPAFEAVGHQTHRRQGRDSARAAFLGECGLELWATFLVLRSLRAGPMAPAMTYVRPPQNRKDRKVRKALLKSERPDVDCGNNRLGENSWL
jgi:hypothetical protein